MEGLLFCLGAARPAPSQNRCLIHDKLPRKDLARRRATMRGWRRNLVRRAGRLGPRSPGETVVNPRSPPLQGQCAVGKAARSHRHRKSRRSLSGNRMRKRRSASIPSIHMPESKSSIPIQRHLISRKAPAENIRTSKNNPRRPSDILTSLLRRSAPPPLDDGSTPSGLIPKSFSVSSSNTKR